MIVGSSGVVRPMTPIRSPFSSTMVLAAIEPSAARAASEGSPDTSRLADTNVVSGTEEMNRASVSGPKSNSWLPIARTS